MKNIYLLVVLGALGALGMGAWSLHGRPSGVPSSREVIVSQAPTTTPTSQPPFMNKVGSKITPQDDYIASGYLLFATQGTPGGFSLLWVKDVATFDPSTKVSDFASGTLKPSDLASRGLVQVTLLNISDDMNLRKAIKRLKVGQRVRASGWRGTLENGGQKLGPVVKQGGDLDVVYLTELQVEDTVYAPASLPAGAAL